MSAQSFQETSRLTIWDAIIAVTGFVSLFAAGAIASAKRPFWYDEVFTWTIVTDPSVRHMLRSISQGADAPAATYQFLARGWLALLVASPRTLRLLSAAGAGVALGVTYLTLRRAFSLRAAALGVLTTLGTSALVLYYSSEARSYGWFLATTAVAAAAWARATEQRAAGTGVLVFVFLANAALVMSHVYGVVYSGMLLLAALAWDAFRRWFRPAFYGSILGSWLTLAPWIPAYRSTAELGKPRGWMQPPALNQLLDLYRFQSPRLPLLFLAVACVICLQYALQCGSSGHRRWAMDRPVVLSLIALAAAGVLALNDPFMGLLDLLLALGAIAAIAWRRYVPAEAELAQSRFLFPAGAFLLAPLAAYGFSHAIRPMFMLRYLIPTTLGAGILITYVVEHGLRVAPGDYRTRLTRATWGGLLALLLVWPVFVARALPFEDTPLYGTNLAAVEYLVPEGVPVVVEDAISFVPLEFETRREGHPYYFALDPASGLDPRSPRGADTSYNHMQATRTAGYFAGHIVPAEEFLQTHDRFAVLHAPRFLWYETRLRGNPAYKCRKLGKIGESEVVLVERAGPEAAGNSHAP